MKGGTREMTQRRKTLLAPTWMVLLVVSSLAIVFAQADESIAILVGHQSFISNISFSPDGKTLASASWDKTIRLWNTSSQKQIGAAFLGHEYSLYDVTFNPDGETLASASSDKTIRLWDISSRKQIGQPLKGHEDLVYSVAFSPDGKILASGSLDRTIRLWDVSSRKQIGQPLLGHKAFVRHIAFSPDGNILASASGDMTIRLWDVPSRKQLGQPLTGHTDAVRSVAFSPDGKTLASGGADKTIRIWDVSSRKQIGQPLEEHGGVVYAVAFSPNGKTLASGSADKTIRLWNVATLKRIGDPLEGHADSVFSVAFSLDGKTLASGSKDHTIRLWDISSLINVDLEATPPNTTPASTNNPTPQPTTSSRPILTIIPNAEQVGLEFTIKVLVGNVKPSDANYTVFINGEPLPLENVSSKDVSVGGTGTAQLTVRLPSNLPEGPFSIAVIAIANGQFSERSEARLEYRARSQDGKPSLYLLAVGVNRYQAEPRITRLNYAAADATTFTEAFAGQQNRIFDKVNITLLTDKQATSRAIKNVLSQIRLKARPNDAVMLFFSGHGVVNDGSYYVLTHDTEPEASDLDSTALRQSDLRDFIDRTSARTIVFLDTCQAGGITGKSAWSKTVDGLSADLGNSTRAPAILTAVTGSQLAVEDSKWGHGAFTYALLEALKSRAVLDSSGEVTWLNLVSAVSNQVKDLTGGKQSPVFFNNGPDFPVFKR
jgi:WD40 repeat protein